jgi:putative membrane protein
MHRVGRIIAILLSLSALILVLVFALENQQKITVSFFGWATPQLPVSVFLTLSLIVGMVIAPILGVLVEFNWLGKTRHLR